MEHTLPESCQTLGFAHFDVGRSIDVGRSQKQVGPRDVAAKSDFSGHLKPLSRTLSRTSSESGSTKLATKLTTKAPLRGVLRNKWHLVMSLRSIRFFGIQENPSSIVVTIIVPIVVVFPSSSRS